MIGTEPWQAANRRLLAKAIGEFAYEELIDPQPAGEDAYRLPLQQGATYRFQARETPWTWLRVDPATVTRDGEPATSAADFLLDAQPELGLSDHALAHLLEEVHNTAYSEARRRERLAGYPAAKLVELPGRVREGLLDGHPKFLADKGRVGWGARERARYAPESGSTFPLRYLAVDRDRCQLTLAPGVDADALLDEGLDADARSDLEGRMAREGVTLDEHVVLPVHPWQFQRHVALQYAGDLADGTLVDLGARGDDYRPRQSIRTLANESRATRSDVKLALTVLNTSCYRGLPGEHLAHGAQLSRWLARLADEDPTLADRLLVLEERAAVHVPHPTHAQAEGPYRYDEMLGAVWRESPQAHLDDGQSAILVAALAQTGGDGRALVAELVDRSELVPREWLRALFDATTVPLYHLMCRYGVGHVAHGQNVGLVLEDHRPARGVLKDVHGDLRLVDRELPEHEGLDPAARDAIDRLRPEHLIQDLITGHLVTTLRFVSPLVEDQLGLPEDEFYAILADTVQAYMDEHAGLADRFEDFPLLADRLDKVCVNRARLADGFGDTSERPLPEFGTPIPNPLAGGG